MPASAQAGVGEDENRIARPLSPGYTSGMKTAISVPDDVYRDAERYARKAGKTRSQLYSDAVRQYLLQHTPDAVTEAMNDACAKIDQSEDGFARAAAHRALRRESW